MRGIYPAETMSASEIILVVNDVDQLLIDPNSPFYSIRKLNRDAEEFIIEAATIASRNDHIHLKIHFRNKDVSRKDELINAIHRHFNYRRKRSEWQLKRALQLGWRTLFVSIVFFAFLVFVTFLIIKLFPEGRLSLTFRDIIIILGWVALWRPADLLLYDWRPLKRDVNLFHKIEQCQVEIVAGSV